MTAIEKPAIIELHSIKKMPVEHPRDTIVFFDLDDTVFDFPYMLGSKAWRKYITQMTKNLDQNWHDIFSLFLARKLPLTTVEPEIVQVIQQLKSNGCIICGLTARERQFWYDTPINGVDELTLSQLNSINIHFDTEAVTKRYPELAHDPEFYEGVFFANKDLKGDYLNKIIEPSSQKPMKVVFIDDKLSQVESVAQTLKQLQIPYECYWYRSTELKASKFDPLIANIQLHHFWMSNGKDAITDEQAEAIVINEPIKKAEDFLQDILTSQIFTK